MNCFEEIELVIDYIENNIIPIDTVNPANAVSNSNCIDMSFVSKLTGIPNGLYQRIFSYVCGISMSEYIRKRRLSRAGYDILQSKSSVIAIAVKYGYDSHSAFTRAFKEQFGVPPTGLSKDTYKAGLYERFSFQDNNDSYYVMKGRKIMADIVKIEYVDMEERMLIGIVNSKDTKAPEMWKRYFAEGYSEKLGELSEYQCEDMTDDYIGIGYAADFKDDKSLGNEYIVGRYFKTDTPVPDNMISRLIPKGIVAKVQIKGKSLDNIINNAYILIKDMAGKNGYAIDHKNFYWSEVYTCERYCIPFESGKDELILDWYIPCLEERD